MRLVPLILAATTCLAWPAWADQCAWVGKEEVTVAFDLIKRGMIVLPYCEPCGDKRPDPPVHVLTTEIRQQDKHLYSLVINGQEVDLAYLYLQLSDGSYFNVAKLVGCPVEGVTTAFPADWYQQAARQSIIHKFGQVDAANSVWQSTGLHYEPGDTLIIRAQGQVHVGGLLGGDVGPDSPGAGALELKIGDGDPIRVGRQLVLAEKHIGGIYLRVKDTQYTDNKGSYQVQILQVPALLMPPAEDF